MAWWLVALDGGAVGSVLYAWALKSLPVKRSCYDLERTMCLSMRAWEPSRAESPETQLESSREQGPVSKTDTQRAGALGKILLIFFMNLPGNQKLM